MRSQRISSYLRGGAQGRVVSISICHLNLDLLLGYRRGRGNMPEGVQDLPLFYAVRALLPLDPVARLQVKEALVSNLFIDASVTLV